MSSEEMLRNAFVSLEVNETFSEAVLGMRDHSRLTFCHRVGERWVKAEESHSGTSGTSLAQQVLARIAMFRLNGKHLAIHFLDGSRWEAKFMVSPGKS